MLKLLLVDFCGVTPGIYFYSFVSDNIIIVDGNYRWIPSRMTPPEHEGGGYGYQEVEQDWTPTDGKGI